MNMMDKNILKRLFYYNVPLWGVACLLGLHASACGPTRTTIGDTPLFSQPLTLTATVSTNAIMVGDPVTLVLTATHPQDTSVTFPNIADGRNIVVRDRTTATEVHPANTNWLQTIQRMDLTSFAVTNHIIAEDKTVTLQTADGVVTQAYPFVTLEVKSSLPENEDQATMTIRGIKAELMEWPIRRNYLFWSILAALLVMAAIAAYFIHRSLTKPRTILHMPPPRPAHEVALEALAALRANGWIEALNYEPFYVHLSAIVRHYMENRFKLRAPELTTEEFIRVASTSSKLSDAHKALVSAFLEQADLVKFARHTPARQDMENALESATRLVHETTPMPGTAMQEMERMAE